MKVSEEDYLMHSGRSKKDGAPVGSGRYPLGSGENPYQDFKDFKARDFQLKRQGLSEKERCEYFGLTMRQYRDAITRASANIEQERYITAAKLRERGWSYEAIGKELGTTGNTAKSILLRGEKLKAKTIDNTAELLKESLEAQGGFIDIGEGSELYVGVSKNKLSAAVGQLHDEGYSVMTMPIRQVFGQGNTTLKVVGPPGSTKKDLYEHLDEVRLPVDIRIDKDGNKQTLRPIENVSSKRIEIKYAEDGGIQKDGVIELRRGVKDLDLGNALYAQVRIGVDGTHYLKGMAVYADDLPDGVDIRFNTNKRKGTPMIASEPGGKEVLKTMQDPSNPLNPFGAAIKPGGQRGALNIVNEEGDWNNWSRTLASQFLSKQNPSMVRKQLQLTEDIAKSELKEICSLENPTLKCYYLAQFANSCEADAVSLKAAALPRQAVKVLLPVPQLKDNEIYAPTFKNGEQVALVRYPHQGIFEIPTLTVNNKGAGAKAAKKFMENAPDAVGINLNVANILSGADFDGDTAVVIPMSTAKVKHRSQLEGLKDFDPKIQYNGDKMDPKDHLSKKRTQQEMGKISNLITDMTILGANDADLAKAVRHAMVVIDADKHNLDWKASERDNDIIALKKKYQGVNANGQARGASTVISSAKSPTYYAERREKALSKMTAAEKRRYYNGEMVYEETGKKKWNGDPVMVRSTKMKEATDAFSLSSGSVVESHYATYANDMKDLARQARKELRATPKLDWNTEAKVKYKKEVSELDAALKLALMNAPLERKAQALANSTLRIELDEHPEYDDGHKKKAKSRHLAAAREATGAGKKKITITDRQWEAIQAGAISDTKLLKILNNCDTDSLRKRAMPKDYSIAPAKITRAKSMLSRGYEWNEVADLLGVSVSTLQKAINN